MSELTERYKELALSYLDITIVRVHADELALLAELDALWWQMSFEEREIIEEWNTTERGKE